MKEEPQRNTTELSRYDIIKIMQYYYLSTDKGRQNFAMTKILFVALWRDRFINLLPFTDNVDEIVSNLFGFFHSQATLTRSPPCSPCSSWCATASWISPALCKHFSERQIGGQDSNIITGKQDYESSFLSLFDFIAIHLGEKYLLKDPSSHKL